MYYSTSIEFIPNDCEQYDNISIQLTIMKCFFIEEKEAVGEMWMNQKKIECIHMNFVNVAPPG